MFLALGFRDGEAFDVVAAAREQPDHAREHARLVLYQDRERVRLGRIVALFHEKGGCRVVHCLFLIHSSSCPRMRASSRHRRTRSNRERAAYWIVRSSRTM